MTLREDTWADRENHNEEIRQIKKEIRERVEKIRAENPFSIQFWIVDAELCQHRVTSQVITAQDRRDSYLAFDLACQKILKEVEK